MVIYYMSMYDDMLGLSHAVAQKRHPVIIQGVLRIIVINNNNK